MVRFCLFICSWPATTQLSIPPGLPQAHHLQHGAGWGAVALQNLVLKICAWQGISCKAAQFNSLLFPLDDAAPQCNLLCVLAVQGSLLAGTRIISLMYFLPQVLCQQVNTDNFLGIRNLSVWCLYFPVQACMQNLILYPTLPWQTRNFNSHWWKNIWKIPMAEIPQRQHLFCKAEICSNKHMKYTKFLLLQAYNTMGPILLH